jgi:hypothetical protein
MNSFFSQLFELFFRKSGDITTDLYDNFLYGNVGIVMCVSSILVCAAFYFLMNHARYAKVSTWLLMFLVNFLVVFLFALFFPKRTLDGLDKIYPFTDYLYFAFVVSFWGMLLFFIFSLIFKRFSTNLARTPF